MPITCHSIASKACCDASEVEISRSRERSIPFGSRSDPCSRRKCLPLKMIPASRRKASHNEEGCIGSARDRPSSSPPTVAGTSGTTWLYETAGGPSAYGDSIVGLTLGSDASEAKPGLQSLKSVVSDLGAHLRHQDRDSPPGSARRIRRRTQGILGHPSRVISPAAKR